jgi:hypothetical protein
LSVENADRILRRLDLTVLDLLDGLTAPREVSEVTPPGAGIAPNEEGYLTPGPALARQDYF